jgi:hypothetical protein
LQSLKEIKMRWIMPALAGLVAIGLAGCENSGARDTEYSQQRAISGDISASFDHGSTSKEPGKPVGQKYPLGAAPWQTTEGDGE